MKGRKIRYSVCEREPEGEKTAKKDKIKVTQVEQAEEAQTHLPMLKERQTRQKRQIDEALSEEAVEAPPQLANNDGL